MERIEKALKEFYSTSPDRKTANQIAREAGITRRQLYNWIHLDMSRRAIEERRSLMAWNRLVGLHEQDITAGRVIYCDIMRWDTRPLAIIQYIQKEFGRSVNKHFLYGFLLQHHLRLRLVKQSGSQERLADSFDKSVAPSSTSARYESKGRGSYHHRCFSSL